MMRLSMALVFTLLAGLLVQADLDAAAKKKKPPQPGGDLTVKGELTDKDGKDRIRTQSYCKTYTFKMEKGKTYQIDMKSEDVDSYLRLEDPKGKQVDENDDGGGFPDARIVYKATETGDFKIIATTFTDGTGTKFKATGKFTLTAKVKDAAATGKAIELKNEKGEGSYTGKIDKDDPVYKAMKKHKLFTFPMEAGKTYQIDMKSKDLDSYLFLESPEGEVLAKDDDSGGFHDARIIHKAANSGQYRIICTYFGIGGEGEFTLTVRQTDKE